MEESYTVDGYPHVSHLVDVSEYFSDFFSCISETVYTLIEDGGDEQTEGDKIEKAMGITSTELEQLSSSLK